MGFLWAVLQARCDRVDGYRVRHGRGGTKMMNGFEVIDLYRPGAAAQNAYPICSIP